MWSHFAFVDVFVDAFLAKSHSHYQNMSSGYTLLSRLLPCDAMTHSHKPSSLIAPPGIMGLSSGLLFVTSVLKSFENDTVYHKPPTLKIISTRFNVAHFDVTKKKTC